MTTPLDPVVAALFENAVKAGRPALSAGSPADARTMVAAQTEALGSGPGLFAVTDLAGARLDGARLDGADFSGADLTGASLVGARIDGARFDGARLGDCIWTDRRRCRPGSVGQCD